MPTAHLLLAASIGGELVAHVPPGFVVERASEREGSFLTLAFDATGAILVGVEDGPILRLVDADGDGFHETDEVFCAALVGCQGLAVRDGDVYAVAHGTDGPGVWRIGPDRETKRIVSLLSPNEHGAHGMAFDVDGALLLVCGDEGSIGGEPLGGLSLEFAVDGGLLATLEDPLGIGRTTRLPYGFVARLDPSSGAWGYHSIGYRNPYALAVDAEGEIFTWDSDMEYDVGLPWYRPSRLLAVRAGADHGFRRGSAVRAASHPASVGAVTETGRASPTGLAFAAGSGFPAPWREMLFGGDWSNGRVTAFELAPHGASFRAEARDFAEGRAFAAVTGLAFGPDGALHVLRGGRGVRGPVLRVAWRGDRPDGDTTRRPGAAERALRRATERLALRIGAAEPFAAELVRLFASPDPALVRAAHAATSGLERADRARVAREVAASAEPRIAAEGLLAISTLYEGTFDRAALDEWLALAARAPESAPAILAAIEAAAMRGRVARADLRAALDARATPAHGAAAPIRDELDAWAGGLAAVTRFLGRAASAADRVEAIRHARLAAATEGWTPEVIARFLVFHESTRAWSGGASFHGYLRALRDAAAADDECIAALLADHATVTRLPLPALAFLLRRANVLPLERRVELGVGPAELAVPLADLAARAATTTDADVRRAAIVELDGALDADVLDWLRDRARSSEEERGVALKALARARDPVDAELFVDGLASTDLGTPKDCADALVALAAPPADAETWMRVLREAGSAGQPRGWSGLRVLAAWLGEPPPDMEIGRFDDVLRRTRASVRARFPEVAVAEVAPPPNRDPDRLLRFLVASRSRPTSASAGRAAFQRATCSSCHTIGDATLSAELSAGASGPDLAGVARRLRRRELFDAVTRPSLSIADRYRASLIETHDGVTVEGRITRDEADGLEIVTAGGRAVWIDAADVASRRVSLVSSMPEGLLQMLTLEEVRDLFAFLEEAGGASPADDAEPSWRPMFGASLDDGWTGGGGRFTLEDGHLVGRAARIATPEYLVSDMEASDFEVEFDVRLTRGGNSGLQYRSRIDLGAIEPVGYQADLGQIYWGSLYASDGRGLIHEALPRRWRAAVDIDGWNHVFLRVVGDRHVIEVNGEVLTDARDEQHASGRFAWQLHHGLEMELRVANARVRVWR